MLDHIDYQILLRLQANAKVTNAQLAQDVGLSPAATLERVRRLEQQGFILGYHAQLSPECLGQRVRLCVQITLNPQDEAAHTALKKAIAQLPGLVAYHRTSGSSHYWIELLATDLIAGEAVIQQHLARLPMVAHLVITVIFHTHKSWGEVPVVVPRTP